MTLPEPVSVAIEARPLARLYRSLRRYAELQAIYAAFFQLPGVRGALSAADLIQPFSDDELRLVREMSQHDIEEAEAALQELSSVVPPGTLHEDDAD